MSSKREELPRMTEAEIRAYATGGEESPRWPSTEKDALRDALALLDEERAALADTHALYEISQQAERESAARECDMHDALALRERERDEAWVALSGKRWCSDGGPLTGLDFAAIRARWATAPEQYQADADAMIAGLIEARAALAENQSGPLADRSDLPEHERGVSWQSWAALRQGLADALRVRAEKAEVERDEARSALARLREAAVAAAQVCGCSGASGCPWTPLHRAIAEVP